MEEQEDLSERRLTTDKHRFTQIREEDQTEINHGFHGCSRIKKQEGQS